MSSILLIGGSGFFGKSFLDTFQRGLLKVWGVDKIIVFSRQADQLRVTHPELLSDAIQLVNGDISHCQTLPKADYIIHAAASTDAARYLSAGDIEKNNMISGTINFCCILKGLYPNSKILYISSGAVYGASSPTQQPFSEEDAFIDLKEVADHKRDYTAAKRDSELEILQLAKLGFSVSIARCFAFVGKYLPRDQHFAIGNFLQNGFDRQPIEVKAQHLVYRSYMYADDMVMWLMHIIQNSSPICPIFNLGSDQAIEVGNLANLIAKKLNTTVQRNIINEPLIDYYVPSIQKIKRELYVDFAYTLDESIDETIRSI